MFVNGWQAGVRKSNKKKSKADELAESDGEEDEPEELGDQPASPPRNARRTTSQPSQSLKGKQPAQRTRSQRRGGDEAEDDSGSGEIEQPPISAQRAKRSSNPSSRENENDDNNDNNNDDNDDDNNDDNTSDNDDWPPITLSSSRKRSHQSNVQDDEPERPKKKKWIIESDCEDN